MVKMRNGRQVLTVPCSSADMFKAAGWTEVVKKTESPPAPAPTAPAKPEKASNKPGKK